jgi:hypothetical protein
VIAASYGDGVGRAEFSKRHVLALRPLTLGDACGLIRDDAMRESAALLAADLEALRSRAGDRPPFALAEIEMEGHYMRNMIGHGMSIIDHSCKVYQLFTKRDVYASVWRVHPAYRSDATYAEVLERLDPVLARMPWSRTNRAIRGRTIGADDSLCPWYQFYGEWVRGPLFESLRERVDPDWFAATGLFDAGAIRRVEEATRRGDYQYHGTGRAAYEPWLWLATFRRFHEWLEERGKRVRLATGDASSGPTDAAGEPAPQSPALESASRRRPGGLRLWLRRSPRLLALARRARLEWSRRRALRRYPPEPGPR